MKLNMKRRKKMEESRTYTVSLTFDAERHPEVWFADHVDEYLRKDGGKLDPENVHISVHL